MLFLFIIQLSPRFLITLNYNYRDEMGNKTKNYLFYNFRFIIQKLNVIVF